MQGGGVMIDVDCFSHDTLSSSIATAAAAAAASPNYHTDAESIRLKFRQMYRSNRSSLQAKFWKTLEDVIIEILVLVPSILNDSHNKQQQQLLLPLTQLKHIALLGASTQLTIITRTLATALLDYSAKAANAKSNIRPVPLGTAIRQEANEIINQLQKIECLVVQEKARTTAEQVQSINADLVSHAHNLVDAFTAFSVSSAVVIIESTFSLHDFRPTPEDTVEEKDLATPQHPTRGLKSTNLVGESDKRLYHGLSSLKAQQVLPDFVPPQLPLNDIPMAAVLECTCKKEKNDICTTPALRKPLPGGTNISAIRPAISSSTSLLIGERISVAVDSQTHRHTPSSSAAKTDYASSMRNFLPSPPPSAPLTFDFLVSQPLFSSNDQTPSVVVSTSRPAQSHQTAAVVDDPMTDSPPSTINKDIATGSDVAVNWTGRSQPPTRICSGDFIPADPAFAARQVPLQQKQYLTAPLPKIPSAPPPQTPHIAPATLKHHRSESDLARVQNMFATTSSLNNKSVHPPHVPPKTDHSLSVPSRPIPQRTSSMCTHTLASSPASTIDLEQNTTGASWNLLRSLRRNHSSTNLKRHTEQETLREGRDDLRTTTSAPSFRTKYEGKHSTYQGSTVHVSENGHDVLVTEMVAGKQRVVAGTSGILFLRLADDCGQDLDYVDTYIMNHACFTTSSDLFGNLVGRFHLEVRTDQIVHVKRCIQVKVLNVIARWIKIQYQDFKNNGALQQRLEAFINGDILQAGFTAEAAVIKDTLDTQMARHSRRRHSLVGLTYHSFCSFGTPSPTRNSAGAPTPSSSQTSLPPFRRQQQQLSSPPYSPSSMLSSFLSSTSSTPPASPTCLSFSSPPSHAQSILFAIDPKYIARYLTLADFYILKCITTYDYLHGQWRQREKQSSLQTDQPCYIAMMTKRANTLTHWVIHELVSMKGYKQRRAGLRRILDIAKLCLEFNNFHTAMVLTMGLVTSPVQKLEDVWDGLPKTDVNTFMALQKYLDLGNNMAHYRHAFQKRTAKRASPSIPFFPVVLKDITFYMDGVATILPASTLRQDQPVVNFGKFHDITKFVNQVLSCTRETYRFANELDHLAFFSSTGNGSNSSMDPSFLSAGPLDQMAEVIEHRLRKVADCLSNNPSRCELFSGSTFAA